MMTKNGPYFKAGVAIAPCTDYRLYDTAYTERSMGLPQENSAGYDSTSTITWIDRMKGSLLLMHGTADDNVHAQHTSHFCAGGLESRQGCGMVPVSRTKPRYLRRRCQGTSLQKDVRIFLKRNCSLAKYYGAVA